MFLGCKSPFPSGQHHFPCGPGPGMGPGQGRLLTDAGPAPAPPQPRGLSPGAARGPPALPKLPWHEPGRLLGCAPPALTLPRARPGRRRKSIRATRGCGGKAAAAGRAAPAPCRPPARPGAPALQPRPPAPLHAAPLLTRARWKPPVILTDRHSRALPGGLFKIKWGCRERSCWSRLSSVC